MLGCKFQVKNQILQSHNKQGTEEINPHAKLLTFGISEYLATMLALLLFGQIIGEATACRLTLSNATDDWMREKEIPMTVVT